MKRTRAVAVLALLLVAAGELVAQVPVVVGPSGGVGFSFSRGRVYGGFYLGGYGPGYYGPVFYAPPYYPYYAATRITQVTIYSPPLEPRPIVVAPQININVNVANQTKNGDDLRDEDFPDKIIIRPGQKTKKKADEQRPPAALPGEKAGDVRPPQPVERERAPKPAPEPKPDALPAPEPQAPLPPWIPDQPQPQPPQPQAAPAERYIALGKVAFASQEYARAERWFRQATAENPREALAYFYLAQAQFALGKYREAVAAIHAGLRLRPTWPTSGFRARALYVLHGADFVEHLQALEEADRRHAEDPVLLFLYAYQLWFDGREEQARVLFRKAQLLVADPRYIRLFLQAQPAGPVVAR